MLMTWSRCSGAGLHGLHRRELRERRTPVPLAVLLALVAVLLAWPMAQAQAQALWGGSEIGMTVEQSRQRFPEAVMPDSPDELYSGAIERLRIPAVELAGHRFQVSFFFLGGRLTQVMLSLVDDDADVARHAFDALSQLLRDEHGAELTTERTAGFVTKSRSTWRSGSTHVVLLHSVFGDADPLLNLVYQELPAER